MKSLKLHRSRRWWTVVVISGILVLSLIAYGIYSVLSWQSYQQRTDSWQQSTKQTLEKTLSLPATSDIERTRKLAALNDTADQMRKNQSSVCTPARLTGWHLAIDGAQAARERCGAYSLKVNGVTKQLNIIIAYLEDEKKMLAALQPALVLPKAVSEKDWDQTVTVWESAQSEVSAMTVSAGFTLTKDQTTSVIAAIGANWKELTAAHAKKDKASFVAAATKLQKSYEAVADIATVNNSQLNTLSVQLQTLVDKL